ncbi:MAG: M23 family metallopeptidase [Emcibacteraceae bacterium]|nr:M23 family metallopeptidase [Emcibacteraceae bacterium]
MKISSIINWLNDKADRYFPERQLYFRTNGDVRFVTVSQKIQIFSSVFLIGFTLWFVVASYNYVYINQIINEKDSEVEIASSNYDELETQYKQLKNNIQKSATALEQRQQYIQQVLEQDNTVTIPADDITILDNDIADDDYDDTLDNEARNLIRENGLDQIYVDLKHIEMEQNNTIRMLTDNVDSKLVLLKDTLTGAGIDVEKMLELAGDDLPSSVRAQGGPFIGLENGINDIDMDNSSFNQLYTKRSNLEDLAMAIAYLPTATPPEKYYISSKFGVRRDPFTKKWATHKGIDMAGWRNTPINASGDGIIKRAGRNGSFGLFIEIDHGNGFRSRYGHLSKLKVKKGEKVTENQLIGLMGSTGRSQSTHLHYEIWFNGKPIDPLKVIKAAKDVQKIKQQKFDS